MPGPLEHLHADGRRGAVDDGAEMERLRDDAAHVAGERVGGGLRILPRQIARQHDELVAAQPGDDGAARGDRAQPVGHLPQQPIADAVAVQVVERLEIVQVDEEQRPRPAPPGGLGDGIGRALAQGRAVRQAGQGIAVGQFAHALLRAPALADIGEEAVPDGHAVVAPLGRRGRARPDVDAVEPAHAELVVPGLEGLHALGDGRQEPRTVVGMDAPVERRRIGHQGLGRDAAQGHQALADEGEARRRVLPELRLEQAARRLGGDLGVALLLGHQRHRAGDLAHRALVVQRLARGRVAHQTGIFGDPDALARLVAVDLGDEVAHDAALRQLAAELLAPVRLDIPFARDVVDGEQHLGFALVAVEAHQRRVGAELHAIHRRAVDPFRDRIVDRLEAGLGPAVVPPVLEELDGQHEVGPLGDEADFGRDGRAVTVAQLDLAGREDGDVGAELAEQFEQALAPVVGRDVVQRASGKIGARPAEAAGKGPAGSHDRRPVEGDETDAAMGGAVCLLAGFVG